MLLYAKIQKAEDGHHLDAKEFLHDAIFLAKFFVCHIRPLNLLASIHMI